MTVNDATALHAERDGKQFSFCSDHCRKKFLSAAADAKPEDKSGFVPVVLAVALLTFGIG